MKLTHVDEKQGVSQIFGPHMGQIFVKVSK